MSVVPARLRRGDTVRVIAPSGSKAMIDEHDHSALAAARGAGAG